MIKSIILLVSLFVSALSASAQTPSVIGTWTLIGADKILPDGTRVPDYGVSPHGLAIFTADGHYAIEIYRADRTHFASGDRHKGTLEEYKDASLGMSVHYGLYTIDTAKGTISFHIDRASFPNLDDTTQVRTYELKGEELSWKVAARPDGSIPVTILRRLK